MDLYVCACFTRVLIFMFVSASMRVDVNANVAVSADLMFIYAITFRAEFGAWR